MTPIVTKKQAGELRYASKGPHLYDHVRGLAKLRVGV